MRELVDLYGRQGFDVLCVTDHTTRTADPWLSVAEQVPRAVHRANYAAYLDQLTAEAERASALYGLLVIPGLELTYNDLNPLLAAHALAIGSRQLADVDGGLDAAISGARASGAAIIAAHPFRGELGAPSARATQRFANEWRELDGLVHRYELFNRTDLFAWVAEAGLPGVATGDFHRPEHLAGWKTLIPCAHEEEAVVSYLRSRLPVYLARLGPGHAEQLAA